MQLERYLKSMDMMEVFLMMLKNLFRRKIDIAMIGIVIRWRE